jgi:hypothetical protein
MSRVRRYICRFLSSFLGNNGTGNIEVLGYAINDGEPMKTQQVFLEYLTGAAGSDGRIELKTKRVDYYQNKSAVTIIDGDTLEAHQEEVVVEKTNPREVSLQNSLSVDNSFKIKDAEFREIKK